MNEKTKAGIYQILFGQPDIPVSTDISFEPEAKETILSGLLILSVTGIIITLLATQKNN